MRDDLHKGAPVPPRYRSLIKACEGNGSDHDELVAQQRASNAVVEEFQRELSSRFIHRLHEAFTAPQQVMPIGSSAGLSLPRDPRTPLEARVLEHLSRHFATTVAIPRAVAGALRDSIRERVSAHERAIDGYLAQKLPFSRALVMQRIRTALGTVPIDNHCAALLRGERFALAPQKRIPIDIDEDLR